MDDQAAAVHMLNMGELEKIVISPARVASLASWVWSTLRFFAAFLAGVPYK